MFSTTLTDHFAHLLPLGGQLDSNIIKGNSVNFVRSYCMKYSKYWKLFCSYRNFELKIFIYKHNPICVTLVDCICHWIII